jgi:hypothetical protein
LSANGNGDVDVFAIDVGRSWDDAARPGDDVVAYLQGEHRRIEPVV